MQPTISERLEHIATAIRNIRQFTSGRTRASFESDLVTRLAVERLLEVISEASRHIPAEAKSRESLIDWRRLADRKSIAPRVSRNRCRSAVVMIENDLEPLDRFIGQIARESSR